MNWLDIAILVLLALFALLGIRRGFIKGTFSILAIILGIIAGVMFYDLAGLLLVNNKLIENRSIASVLGFIIVTFFVYVGIQLIAWLITKLMGTLHLSLIDRLAGGLLGVIIGVITVFILISALGLFYSEDESPFDNSVLIPYINGTFAIINETVPEDFKDHLQQTRKIIQKEGMKAILKFKESEKVKNTIKEEKKDSDKPGN